MKSKKHLIWIILAAIAMAAGVTALVLHQQRVTPPPEAPEASVASVHIEVQKPQITIPSGEPEETTESSEDSAETPTIILEPDDKEQSTAVNSSPIIREDVQLPAMDAPIDNGPPER